MDRPPQPDGRRRECSPWDRAGQRSFHAGVKLRVPRLAASGGSFSAPASRCSRSSALPDVQPGDGVPDDHALDLGRALEDREVIRREWS